MSAGDFSAFADFFAPTRVERPFEQMQRQQTSYSESVRAVLATIDEAADRGACREEAFLQGVEHLRELLTPVIRSPRGVKDRPPSRKARNRAIGPINRWIAEGRGNG